MYNEERKLRYIESARLKYTEDYVTNLYSLFNKTGSIEELFQKDVAEFNHNDISNLYAYVRYSDEYTYSNTNSRLISYVDWCLEQNLVLDGMNHFREFVLDDFKKYINQKLQSRKYLTRKELMEFVNRIANPRDQFVVMCLFEIGKSDNFEDILKMKLEDINESENTVKLNSGKVVHVTDDFIRIAKEADKQTTYFFVISENERAMNGGPYIFKKVYGSVLPAEGVANAGNKLVARVIKTLIDTYGGYEEINTSSLAVSGQIDMINRRSKEMGITKEEYVVKHFDDLRTQYNLSPNMPRVYWKKYKDYI